MIERPVLEGSPKQIAWAEGIRERFIESIGDRITDWSRGTAAWEGLCNVIQAKTWIDNRDKLNPERFIQRVAELQVEWNAVETDWRLEDAIQEQISDSRITFDDECFDEAEIFAIVYSDYIEVKSTAKGAGDKLPKNRKYVGGMGDMRWAYALDRLDELRACKAIDFILTEKGELISRIGIKVGLH